MTCPCPQHPFGCYGHPATCGCPPETLREVFIRELRASESLDCNGYICTKNAAIKAFDRALAVTRPNLGGEA